MKNLLTQLAYPVLVGAGMLFSGAASAQCSSFPAQSDYYIVHNGNYATNYDRKNACVNWTDNTVLTCEPVKTGVGSNTDIQIIKMKQDGNKDWEYTYPLNGTNDQPQSIIKVSDGYVITGVTNSGSTDAYLDVFMMKINNSGVFQWFRNYENTGITFSWSMATVAELTDGNLAVVGMCDHVVEIHTFYFLKTNSRGTSAQHKRYRMTGRRYQTLEDVVATPNGGFIATGSSGHNFDYNGVMAIAFNSSFNPVWAKNYILYTASGAFPNMGGAASARSNITGKAIAKGSDGYYRIAGFHHNAQANGSGLTFLKGLVMQVDGSGNFNNTSEELWSYGSNYTVFNDINECDNINNRWLVAGTLDVNTSTPKSMLAAWSSGIYRSYLYWGNSTENRAYNIFDRRVSQTNPPLHNTYVTGLNNYISGTVNPYIVKLEANQPACITSVSADDEITERTWQTVDLSLPTPSTLVAIDSPSTSASSNCKTMVEPCDDYICNQLSFLYSIEDARAVIFTPVFPSLPGHTFSYTMDFGDGSAPATGTTTAPFLHVYGSSGPFLATMTVQVFQGSTLVATCVINQSVPVVLSTKVKPQVHTTNNATFSKEVEIAYNPMTNSIYKVQDYPELPKLLAGKDMDVKVYPNPGNEYTQLELNMPEAGEASVEMYDAAGRLVLVVADHKQMEKGINMVKADVNGLPKGIYYFRIQTAESIASRPFIKQ